MLAPRSVYVSRAVFLVPSGCMEVVSFRVFEVRFGAVSRGGVSEHGLGQFRSHAMVSLRARPARMDTNRMETAHMSRDTDSRCATGRRNYPPLIRKPRQPTRN